ncbi:MAG: hypothetical protein AAFP86_12270 [Planctomycetota bacterium]
MTSRRTESGPGAEPRDARGRSVAADRALLRSIDRALLRLLEERARVVRASGPLPDPAGHRADLVRRTPGGFPPGALHRVLDAVDAGCDEAIDRTGGRP